MPGPAPSTHKPRPMTDPNPIPYEGYGGDGPVLHFAHANGYPPLAYRELFDGLSTHSRVLAMRMRPLWPGSDPQALSDWQPLADDLARFLDQHGLSGLVGWGHSMGAVTTLRLALRQPDRFRALVLIDPVLFPPLMIVVWDLIYRLGLGYRLHPLVRAALKRHTRFESREAMFANYRHKAVFQRMSDTALQNYVDALGCPRPDGSLELCYPAIWEARIYATGLRADQELWQALPGLKPPLLILRGAETGTFWERTGRLVQRRLPSARVHTVPDSTHLVALERPTQVLEAARQHGFLEY
jgi:pimeloyl-ACP methyl ester carboxylesterase